MADAHHRVAVFVFEAQRADVVILGRERHFNFETPERRDATLAQVVRSSPRPMVLVPQIVPEGTGDPAQACAIARAAGDFLAAHDVIHRVHTVGSSAAPAEVLLEEVDRRRPRLLVMGAHRAHPLRDLFATSVTRAVLGSCPVPIFVGA